VFWIKNYFSVVLVALVDFDASIFWCWWRISLWEDQYGYIYETGRKSHWNDFWM